VNATFTGLHTLDDRLPDWSVQGRAIEAAEMRRIRHDLNDTARTTVADWRSSTVALDAELARANLDVRLAEHDSRFFHARNPALWTGEAIFGAVSLMIRPFAPAHDRGLSLAARLAAVPRFLGAMPAAMTSAMPAAWIARAVSECETADALFDRGLVDWLHAEDLSSSQAEAILDAAAAARRAFADAAAWLRTQVPADEREYAAGEALFDTLLTRGHFCTETPDQLLTRALTELPVEQQRLTELCVDYPDGWHGAQEALAADHPSASDFHATFQRRWDDCHRIATAADAVTWAPWPIRYVPIPAWAQEFAPQLYWLFYRSPAPFDPYDTYDYVVTPIDASLLPDEQERRLRAWNHSTITLNHVVHHGAVGHHVQNWHARSRAASRIGRIAATDCASRIGMFLGGSMAEGWACYATRLMEELGMLTPLERISEQHTRVRMLARAIIDIRLHTGRCTFSEAVQYYQDKVGMPIGVATAETTKNSMFPCTALMYWLGTSAILSLRDTVRARSERAAQLFRLRQFHDELLSRGAIPVLLVASLMTEPAS
jgi:hypothetical protein